MKTTYELDRLTNKNENFYYIIGDYPYDETKYNPDDNVYVQWWQTYDKVRFIPSFDTDYLVQQINQFKNKPDISESTKLRIEFMEQLVDERGDLFTGDIYKHNPKLETIPHATQALHRSIENNQYNKVAEYNNVAALIENAIQQGEFTVTLPYLSAGLRNNLETDLGYIVTENQQLGLFTITWENRPCIE